MTHDPVIEHLPECWAKHDSDPPAWCICDELRSCEVRVRQDERAAALRDAIEAVVAIDPLMPCGCTYEAIAAIEALGGER